MYLSPGVAPPTYTPPPSPRSYPQRHRGAARNALSVIPPAHAASILLLPSAFRLSSSFRARSNFSARFLLPPHLYATTMCNHPRTSLHAAFTFPRVLTHVYFSPLSSPSSSTPSCVVSPLRSPVTNAYQRRDIQTPVESSRRIASRRVGSSCSPTSPLAYCFREFDEILPRDANGPPCTFFDSTVGHSELN